jgi:hypothetical protein
MEDFEQYHIGLFSPASERSYKVGHQVIAFNQS